MKNIDKYIYGLAWLGGVMKHLNNASLFALSFIRPKDEIEPDDYLVTSAQFMEAEESWHSHHVKLREHFKVSDEDRKELESLKLTDETEYYLVRAILKAFDTYETEYDVYINDILTLIDLFDIQWSDDAIDVGGVVDLESHIKKVRSIGEFSINRIASVTELSGHLLGYCYDTPGSRYYRKDRDELFRIIAMQNPNENASISLLGDIAANSPCEFSMLVNTTTKDHLIQKLLPFKDKDVSHSCFCSFMEMDNRFTIMGVGGVINVSNTASPLVENGFHQYRTIKDVCTSYIYLDIVRYLNEIIDDGDSSSAGGMYVDLALYNAYKDKTIDLRNMHCWNMSTVMWKNVIAGIRRPKNGE